MKTFTRTYRPYIRAAAAEKSAFGFEIESMAKIEPVLSWLYHHWWKVKFSGLEHLPPKGPALIAGNTGLLPWAALMLAYALMSSKSHSRRLNILADLNLIDDERLHQALTDIGFVPATATNAKALFAAGQLVLIFPESTTGCAKTFSERYRLRPFDWSQFLPAVESGVPVYPLAATGCDEAYPVFANLNKLAQFLALPAYPVTPFFPWLPFPLNCLSLPVPWAMHLGKPVEYKANIDDRDSLENTAKELSGFLQGEIQADLNRLLRARIKKPK